MQEHINMPDCNRVCSQACWNCGRAASETCSGCGLARYCGAFCQHKDWEEHGRVCRNTADSAGNSAGDGGNNTNNSSNNTSPGPEQPSLVTTVPAAQPGTADTAEVGEGEQ